MLFKIFFIGSLVQEFNHFDISSSDSLNNSSNGVVILPRFNSFIVSFIVFFITEKGPSNNSLFLAIGSFD